MEPLLFVHQQPTSTTIREKILVGPSPPEVVSCLVKFIIFQPTSLLLPLPLPKETLLTAVCSLYFHQA